MLSYDLKSGDVTILARREGFPAQETNTAALFSILQLWIKLYLVGVRDSQYQKALKSSV